MNIDRIPAVPLLALVVVVNMFVSPALAHHSRTVIYDTDVQIEMEEVVTQWRWANPMESSRSG